ncbi:MAG: caspase family protein [Elusimicrobiota bacterium]|nr:MAG: caspase family protein [Elusimicrobiota bacterium]
MKALVESGGDINAINSRKVSVLFHTFYKKRIEVAKYLIDVGARPHDDIERVEIEKMLREAGELDAIAVMSGRKGTASVSSAAPSAPTTLSSADIDRIAKAVHGSNPSVFPKSPSTLSTLEPKFSQSQADDDFAVVIGIENYADIPAARFAERDATGFKEFIRALGVPERNIMTLTGTRATRTGLVKAFEAWLPNNVSDKSRVYVYYSGHGAPDAKTKQAYLVPSDGDPQYLAETGYPLDRLYEKLGKLKAKQVLVALDSCFSGAGGRSVLAKGTRPLVGKIDLAPNAGSKVAVLSASGGDQISGSNEDAGYGTFTYNLLTGLNGAAKNAQGQVTLQSLYDYVKPKVQDEARRANREQTPQLQSASPDEFILRAK